MLWTGGEILDGQTGVAEISAAMAVGGRTAAACRTGGAGVAVGVKARRGKAMDMLRFNIERGFADAKEKHPMRDTQYRGLAQVTNWVKLNSLP